MTSLKLKTVSGIKWQVVNKVSQKVISVLTFAILARILEPSAFGLFALAFIVIDALQFFKSFGFDTALIQRKEDASFQKAMDTAFVIIQINGFALFFLCMLLAPWSAQYFDKPELLGITRALGFIFIFTCFSKIPTTLLLKKMRFNTIAWISLVSALLNSIVAIAVAFYTKNVWSLIIAYLIRQIILSISSWYFSGYRFTWSFDRTAAKELFHFGKYLMGMSILWLISGKLNDVVVGKMLGVTMLGYLVLAQNIGNFINTHFTSLISEVMFPAYSKLQHDSDDLKRAYLKTIKYVSFFSAPFSIFLICFAEQFTYILYGSKWIAIIPLIRLFGLIQLVSPIVWCSGSLFMGCGKPNYSFNLTASSLVLRIPMLLFFAHWWGVKGAILATLITTIIFSPFNIYLVKRVVNFRMNEFFSALKPSYLCALGCYSIISLMQYGAQFLETSEVFFNSVLQLMLFGFIGGSLYLIAIYKADPISFLDIKSMMLMQKNEKAI